MEFQQLIKERYSVRRYEHRSVEQEKIDLILNAAKYAPTAKNFQPQHIYILQSQETLEKIHTLSPCIYGAPLVLIVCADEQTAWKNPSNHDHSSIEVDAAIVCDEMMLAAWELGIGSCWVGRFDPDAVAQAFDLPASVRPVAILLLGYPSERSKPLTGYHDVYRPMSEMITYL